MLRRIWLLGLLLPFAGCELAGLDGITTILGSIGDSCAQVENCRPGLACEGGKCAALGNTPEGGDCLVAVECKDDLFCDLDLKCRPAGDVTVGGECQGPASCERGLNCALVGFSGICVAAGDQAVNKDCEDSSECMAGLLCTPGKKCLPPATLLLEIKGEDCPADGTLDPPMRAHFSLPRDGVDMDFYQLPFPNDVRRKDGKVDYTGHPTPGDVLVGVDVVQTYIDKIGEEVDGFATNPTVYFRFSGPINFESIDGGGDDANLVFVDLGTGDKVGMSYAYSSGRGRYMCQNHLDIRPPEGQALKPATTYAVYMTNAVKGDGDTDIAATDDFKAAMAATAPAEATLKKAWDAYAPLRTYLETNEIDPTTLINAAVFTTQDPNTPMSSLYDAVQEAQMPVLSDVTLCADGVTSPCEGGGEGRSCGSSAAFHEIHAKLSVPIYQEGEAPYKSEGGSIKRDSAGKPQLVRTEKICLAIAVPKTDPPEGGKWPVAIYMHGTGGDFRSHMGDGTASRLNEVDVGGTKTRFVTVGFDAILHGPRRNGSEEDSDRLVFNFLNPNAARDNFLQGSADLYSVVRWAKGAAIAGALEGAVELDGDHITFIGHSQGGTHGGLGLAFEPAIETAVLSGAGGHLVQSLLGKKSPVDIASAFQLALAEERPMSVFHPVLNVLQVYFERSDPLNFGRLITRDPPNEARAKNVFMTYGLEDTYTPVKTMRAFARSLGVDMVNEPIDEGGDLGKFTTTKIDLPAKGNKRSGMQTVVLEQYQPGDYDGHFVVFRHDDAKKRAAAFLATSVTDAEGVPTLIE